MREPPDAAQVAMPKVIAATSVPAMREAARRATIAELDGACAEITLGGIAINGGVIDVTIGMSGADSGDHPMRGFDDAALHARLALILAAAKRHPEAGAGITAWTRSLYEPHTAREAIPALYAALPDLQRKSLAAVSQQRSRRRGTTSGPTATPICRTPAASSPRGLGLVDQRMNRGCPPVGLDPLVERVVPGGIPARHDGLATAAGGLREASSS